MIMFGIGSFRTKSSAFLKSNFVNIDILTISIRPAQFFLHFFLSYLPLCCVFVNFCSINKDKTE